MKFVIWGAGERGRRIFFHIGCENVIAFIDLDKSKAGTKLFDKPIISYEYYLKSYRDIIIVISTHEKEVAEILNADKIYNFLYMSDCPEDFQSPNPRNILKQHIQNEIDKNKQYVVYGNTLYSILLYYWIIEITQINQPYIVVSPDISAGLFDTFKKHFDNTVKKDFSEITFKIDRIYNTDKHESDHIPKKLTDKTKNVYRYSEHIKEYYNPQIEKFRNIHSGKRCFIVATGPSLLVEDLNTLSDNKEICISMNSIYKMFENTRWRPSYYVAQDFRMMRDKKEVLRYLDGITAFISDGYAPFCEEEHADNVYINHMGLVWDNKGTIPFSENFAQVSYISGTVAYSCIQLAVYMGFNQIYLLGVDCSELGNNYAKYTHCYNEKELVSISYDDQTLVSYISAKKYADGHGIKIYNATRGGKLEVFERVDFDKIISN